VSGPSILTPPRQRGVEYLDSPQLSSELRARSHRDIRLANRLFGGTRAAVAAIRSVLPSLSRDVTVLDVGAGDGSLLEVADRMLRADGRRTTLIALDLRSTILPRPTDQRLAVCGCATRLPLASDSVDLAMCSLLLHHFEQPLLQAVVRELHRVSRGTVVVTDLRRSWLAVGGLWTASYPLRFHPVSRHDGVTSILRGFTSAELEALVREATGIAPAVRRHLGFRLTATWAAHH
jgi:2-polyprenyl-3-methyl-5-hydroxy-6-metoxy-1,4-benzoquinol methylase